jgi:plastocyanin
MKKTLGVILLLGVAGLLAAVSVAHSASTDGTLQATVGPGFSINVAQNGAKVTHLDPGTYTIAVNDQSAEHNFHLSGPGVEQATDVEATGTTTWTVTFQDGTYTYQCDAHATIMHGSFTVGSAGTTTTTTTPPTPAPLKVRILAAKVVKPKTVLLSVSASRRATLTASLWKGSTRIALTKTSGTKATIKLVAKTALKKGAYTAKVVSGAASASKAVTVR